MQDSEGLSDKQAPRSLFLWGSHLPNNQALKSRDLEWFMAVPRGTQLTSGFSI